MGDAASRVCGERLHDVIIGTAEIVGHPPGQWTEFRECNGDMGGDLQRSRITTDVGADLSHLDQRLINRGRVRTAIDVPDVGVLGRKLQHARAARTDH